MHQYFEKQINIINQLWVDGYNYHLMYFYISANFKNFISSESKHLFHLQMEGFLELSLLYLGKIFDKRKDSIKIMDFLKFIQKNSNSFQYCPKN
ncbi:MAG: hypothetical protein JKY52_20090 [Flavobacteriales bacterium]|nr:hypothetical protein [Flavobacteriales bacterium]